MAREPRDYALLVGVQHYPDYPRFNQLDGPIHDVDAVEAWLLDQATGGGLARESCRALRSKAAPATPILDEVEDELQRIFDSARDGGGRRLYVYFSGHGLASSVLGADLCLVRWSLERRNYALSSEDYKRLTGEVGLFTEIVWLLDCCRTTKVQARGRPPTLQGARPGAHAGNTRFFTAFATEYQSQAFEAERADQGADDPLVGEVRGYFTRALLEALRGGAARREGGVTASDLKDFLEFQTPRLAEVDGRHQQPVIANELAGGDHPAVFGLATRPQPTTTIEFGPERAGIIVLEGPLGELQRADASSGPWHLPLQAGALHLLVEERSGDQKPFRPQAEPGHVHF
ncbi:caspase family protein [Haliangium sp.]|uniref:caspase family protein n=1 Tax=Haliangium sp. TaxID=2663208 RepID=UPI003D128A2E